MGYENDTEMQEFEAYRVLKRAAVEAANCLQRSNHSADRVAGNTLVRALFCFDDAREELAYEREEAEEAA